MFFNWLKKESKIKNQREELLKEAQKNEDRLDPCLPKKTLPKSGVVKQSKENDLENQIVSFLKKNKKILKLAKKFVDRYMIQQYTKTSYEVTKYF